MQEKLMLQKNGKMKFTCPRCKMTRSIALSKIDNYDRDTSSRIKITCKCGLRIVTRIEKRKQPRVRTNLSGIFIQFAHGKEVNRGFLTIDDISPGGVRLKLHNDDLLLSGDEFMVICHHNGIKKEAIIKEEGVIRYRKETYIGAELSADDPKGKSFGLYLFSSK